MTPIITGAHQDDHTPAWGDRTATNLLVSLKYGGMKRVHSDGFEFWITYQMQRYTVCPETLQVTAS